MKSEEDHPEDSCGGDKTSNLADSS